MFRSAYEVRATSWTQIQSTQTLDYISTNGIRRYTMVLVHFMGLQQPAEVVGAQPEEALTARWRPVKHQVQMG